MIGGTNGYNCKKPKEREKLKILNKCRKRKVEEVNTQGSINGHWHLYGCMFAAYIHSLKGYRVGVCLSSFVCKTKPVVRVAKTTK